MSLRSLFRVKFRQCYYSLRARELSSGNDGRLCINEIREQLNSFSGGAISLINVGTKQDIAVLSVSNPEKKNAFTGTMCVALHDYINELKRWKHCRALIIRGLSGMFCAGADLTMAKQIADSKNGERFSYFMQSTLVALHHLPMPSFALVQKNVLGGGAELMIACDFILAFQDTKISFVQGKMGIVPGWAGATHLCQRIGYHRTLDLLLTSKILNCNEALAMGLVDFILNNASKEEQLPDKNSDERMLQTAIDFIESKIGHLEVNVLHALKSVTNDAIKLSYDDSIINERNVFKSLWGGKANLQAIFNNIKHKN